MGDAHEKDLVSSLAIRSPSGPSSPDVSPGTSVSAGGGPGTPMASSPSAEHLSQLLRDRDQVIRLQEQRIQDLKADLSKITDERDELLARLVLLHNSGRIKSDPTDGFTGQISTRWKPQEHNG